MKEFQYRTTVEWMGNDGSGTSTKTFGRDSEISTPDKPTLLGSAQPEFSGDGVSWAPEDLFVRRSASATCSRTCSCASGQASS